MRAPLPPVNSVDGSGTVAGGAVASGAVAEAASASPKDGGSAEGAEETPPYEDDFEVDPELDKSGVRTYFFEEGSLRRRSCVCV